MVKIYKQPFAHDGEAIAIPDTSQPDGKMSNADGWTSDYQLPKTDPNYKPVGRQEMNGVFKEVTESLGEIQQFGFAKWQPMQWPQGARVVEGDVVYRALNQTSQQPPHADWANDMDALNTKANTSTKVIAGDGLSGGGSLAADRTLSVKYGTTAGTAAQGNDSRIVNSVQTSGNQAVGGIKTFSSFPVTPSAAPTANYQVANKKYVDDSAIGVGQTWQDVTGSRVANTTYTNTTGRPIQLQITFDSKSGDTFYVNGLAADMGDAASAMIVINTVIPAGATYRLTGWATMKSWLELR